jgi:hypothetical protein
MDPKSLEGISIELDLELHIEELESRIAPDNGETFLPLSLTTGKHHG